MLEVVKKISRKSFDGRQVGTMEKMGGKLGAKSIGTVKLARGRGIKKQIEKEGDILVGKIFVLLVYVLSLA